jgi:hypothetical protein
MVHQNHEDEKNLSKFFEAIIAGSKNLAVLLQPAVPFGNSSLPQERPNHLRFSYENQQSREI